MKAIVIGTGVIGGPVADLFRENGHSVVQVGRTSGEMQADLTDPSSLRSLFERMAPFDAVLSAAGEIFPGPLDQADDEQWSSSLASKGMGQINLVRTGLPYVADGGSFTLVSGLLGDEVGPAMTMGATLNGLIEGFVRSAPSELPRGIRVNAVSPTVLAESTAYHPYFVGFTPVPATDVAQAYLRLASNPYNGHVIKLHRTS